MVKWQIVLEVRLDGEPDELEQVLDRVMDNLVDSGIEDPTVGATLASGIAEIEFVVDAATLAQAQSRAREVVAGALGVPGDIIGESTRRALVPA